MMAPYNLSRNLRFMHLMVMTTNSIARNHLVLCQTPEMLTRADMCHVLFGLPSPPTGTTSHNRIITVGSTLYLRAAADSSARYDSMAWTALHSQNLGKDGEFSNPTAPRTRLQHDAFELNVVLVLTSTSCTPFSNTRR